MKAYSPIFITTLAFVMILSMARPGSGAQVARVTYLKADVFMGHTQKGPWQALKKGLSVTEGKFIKTGETGVVELTLPDNSTIRLSAGTIFKLSDVHFPEEGPPKFSAKLFLGRMWAKVNNVVHEKNGTFEAHLNTAVIGVRGTVYNLDVADDKSADVSVFKGIVGVGPPLFVEGAPKEEIAWPMEVTEKKWEEIILKQLQRLHIGADGKPGKPASFDPVKEKDEWILWNQERDTHPT
jgi:hypothetical protein